MLAEFALQSGHLSEGNVVREEIQQAVVLNPVLLRVTIQVRDLADRLRVTDKRERRPCRGMTLWAQVSSLGSRDRAYPLVDCTMIQRLRYFP